MSFFSNLASVGDALSTAGAAVSTRIASEATAVSTRIAEEREAKRVAQAAIDVQQFSAALTEAHVANVIAFLKSQEGAVELYPRPGAAKVATDATATARRLAPLALKAIEQTSYGAVAKLAKAAIKYGSLTGLLLSPSFRVFADEVVPRLVQHTVDAGLQSSSARRGAVEAELALRLWYLGCSEAMDSMLRDATTAAAVSGGGTAHADTRRSKTFFSRIKGPGLA